MDGQIYIVLKDSHEFTPCAVFEDIRDATTYAERLVEAGCTDIATVHAFSVLVRVPDEVDYGEGKDLGITFMSESRRAYMSEYVQRLEAGAQTERIMRAAHSKRDN